MGVKKDPARETFRGLFAKVVWFTIERTDYRARPFRVILWSELNHQKIAMHTMLMSADEMIELSDLIIEALKSGHKS